jgi:hypothetical protein
MGVLGRRSDGVTGATDLAALLGDEQLRELTGLKHQGFSTLDIKTDVFVFGGNFNALPYDQIVGIKRSFLFGAGLGGFGHGNLLTRWNIKNQGTVLAPVVQEKTYKSR